MRTLHRTPVLSMLVAVAALIMQDASAQESPNRESLLMAARDIMGATRYCALITLDESGSPQVRTMDPFLPDEGMVVRFGTIRNSRKVAHIRRDPRVSIYYPDASGAGYVSISGRARLIDDASEKVRFWKEEWEPFYANKEADYILIEVRPETLEVLDYGKGIAGDPTTYEVPSVRFDGNR